MLTVTVSDLHLCQHCPRLFAYAKLKRRKIPPFIGHKGTGRLPGRLFHTFAHTVQKDICAGGTIHTDLFRDFNQETEAFSSVFHRIVKEQYLIPFLEEHGKTLPYERIEAFASACEQWIGYLNDFITPNLSEIPDWWNLLQKTVHSSEYLMRSTYSFPDGEMMQISGRPDALLFDPNAREAVVVEYKARKESDPLQDLAQTSLYSWLVHTSIGILPRVDILYLEEKQPLVRYSVPAIQDVIQNHPSLFQLARDILHGKRPVPQCTGLSLCQFCPYAQTCDGDFGIPVNQTSISPKPGPGNTENQDRQPAPDELLAMLTEKLRLLSIPVIPAGYTVGPRFIRLKIIPDIKKKVTFSKIVNRTVDIQLGLALSSPPLIQAQSGFISCDVQKSNWEPSDVGSLLADTKRLTTHICSFPLGRRIDGSVFVGDLADPPELPSFRHCIQRVLVSPSVF